MWCCKASKCIYSNSSKLWFMLGAGSRRWTTVVIISLKRNLELRFLLPANLQNILIKLELAPMLPLQRLALTSRRTMFSVRKPLWQLPISSGPPIPQQELVDEETNPDYHSATFYPAKPGKVLAQKFQLLVKIGWGSQSTVWLARDISRYLPAFINVHPFMLTSERLICTIKNEMAIRKNSVSQNNQQ